MLKSYEAIYDHGKIEWLSEFPDVEQARVIVTVLPAQQVYSEKPKHRKPPEKLKGSSQVLGDIESTSVAEKPNGARLVSILRATPPELLASIADKFGDPVTWQREQREDRVLPGREAD